MIYPSGVPVITVFETAERRNAGDDFLLLDIREEEELLQARIEDPRVIWIPLSELLSKGISLLRERLEKDCDIIVFCHHGSRSAQLVAWMNKKGWRQVLNMEGGIDAYAALIEPRIGRY